LCKNTKCRYIAKIKEIIKEENSFYCVMDNAEINLTEIIRNDIERKDIYKISRQLIEMLVGLNEENIMVRDIRPSHIFMSTSRGNLKLYHF
jgi:serine/threonine protein kinase